MLSAGQYFANYRIVRNLGVGGMGEVYLAAHPRLPREDALKVLPAELTSDATFRARFTREADLASQLDHPSIVSVYDRGEFEGQLWITMKYIPGSDCNDMLRDSGVPEPRKVAEIVTAVADALDYAHASGMVHRDVKPANILVDDSSSRRKVYLTDFGIARTMTNDTALTAANLTVGSIQYCSPEQLRGLDLDGRSDQYALACTAFRLLTGKAPFPLPTPTAIINAHLNSPAPSATTILPTLSPTIDAVLARAMDKDPAKRYRSCSDFATDFEGALTRPGFKPQTAAAYAPTMINPSPVIPAPPVQPLAAPPQQSPPPSPNPPPSSTTPFGAASTSPYTAQQQSQAPQGQVPQGQPPQAPAQGYQVPQSGAPQSGAPQYGAQQYGAQQYGAQQQSAQQPGGPQYGAQQFGSQQYGSQQYGSQQYGSQPFGAQPLGPGGQPPSKSSNVGKTLVIVGIAAVVLLVIGVGGYFVFRGDSTPGVVASSSSSTTETDTGPTTSSPTTSVGSDPAVVNGVPTQCATGSTARTSTTSPLTSLNITIPATELPTPPWQADSSTEVPFAITASGLRMPRPTATAGWQANILIGTLPPSFGADTEAIARKLVECLPSSPGYARSSPSPASITDTRNNTLDDNRTKYTLINARITVSGNANVQGDDIIVAVIGSSPMTFAFGASPIGDAQSKAEVEKAVMGVRVR